MVTGSEARGSFGLFRNGEWLGMTRTEAADGGRMAKMRQEKVVNCASVSGLHPASTRPLCFRLVTSAGV